MGNDCFPDNNKPAEKDELQIPINNTNNNHNGNRSVIGSDGIPKENAYRTYVKAPTSAGRQTAIVQRLQYADEIPDDIWAFDDNLNRKSGNNKNYYGPNGVPYKRNRMTYQQVPRYPKNQMLERDFNRGFGQAPISKMRNTYHPQGNIQSMQSPSNSVKQPYTFPNYTNDKKYGQNSGNPSQSHLNSINQSHQGLNNSQKSIFDNILTEPNQHQNPNNPPNLNTHTHNNNFKLHKAETFSGGFGVNQSSNTNVINSINNNNPSQQPQYIPIGVNNNYTGNSAYNNQNGGYSIAPSVNNSYQHNMNYA